MTMELEQRLGRMQDLARELLGTAPDAQLLLDTPDEIRLALGGNHLVLLRAWQEAQAEPLEAYFRALVKARAAPLLTLVLVGGPPEAHRVLKRALPWLSSSAWTVFHLRDDGTTWCQPSLAVTPVKAAAKRALAHPPSAPVSPEVLEASLGPVLQVQQARAEEAAHFQEQLQHRRPVLTWVLAGVIGTLFALQSLWGGAEFTPALIRLGANSSRLLLQGEWWRLVSSVFLHGGVVHVLLNLAVLWTLGRFMEQLLGWQRTLVLWTLSGVAGSAASGLLRELGVGVGASGALWGLLGASLALAQWPRGAVPAALLPGLKRNAVTNIGINVFYSLQPGVDLAAHLGGAVMGLLLVGSGLLTRGVRAGEPLPRPSVLLKAATAGMVVLLAGSVGVAWWHDRPWELTGELAWREHRLAEEGLRVRLPAALGELSTSAENGGRSYVAGDILHDPVVVEIHCTALAEPVDGAAWAQLLAAGKRFLPADYQVEQPMADISQGADRRAHGVYAHRNGVTYTRTLRVLGNLLVIVDVVGWKTAPDSWKDLGPRIAGELAPEAPPGNPE